MNAELTAYAVKLLTFLANGRAHRSQFPRFFASVAVADKLWRLGAIQGNGHSFELTPVGRAVLSWAK